VRGGGAGPVRGKISDCLERRGGFEESKRSAVRIKTEGLGGVGLKMEFHEVQEKGRLMRDPWRACGYSLTTSIFPADLQHCASVLQRRGDVVEKFGTGKSSAGRCRDKQRRCCGTPYKQTIEEWLTAVKKGRQSGHQDQKKKKECNRRENGLFFWGEKYVQAQAGRVKKKKFLTFRQGIMRVMFAWGFSNVSFHRLLETAKSL